MARWGLLFSLFLVIVSLFFASGFFTYYAGDDYWLSHNAGFPTGIIHGILAPIMLAFAIFTSYTVYEVQNIGWFYDFGFIVGILLVWGGGQGTTHIVKNYYHKKFSKEDGEKIEKIVEEKVNKKLTQNSENKRVESKSKINKIEKVKNK